MNLICDPNLWISPKNLLILLYNVNAPKKYLIRINFSSHQKLPQKVMKTEMFFKIFKNWMMNLSTFPEFHRRKSIRTTSRQIHSRLQSVLCILHWEKEDWRFLFDDLTFSESMFSTTGHASTFDNLSICLIVPPPTFIAWRSSNWNDAIAFIVVFSTGSYFEVFHRFDHVTSKVHKCYEPRDAMPDELQ